MPSVQSLVRAAPVPRDQPAGGIVRPVTAVIGAAVALAGAAQARQWMATWGSTDREVVREMPGDDLILDPLMCVTRSVSVRAPAPAVWAWIAQIGSSDLGRAGWYSYDRLDNGGVASADHLLTGVPEPVIGQRLVSDPNFAWTVRAVDPGRSLVLDIQPPGKLRVHATFAFEVKPVDDASCRLVERSWWDMRPRWAGVPFSLIFEAIDFVMMRKHLITVRDRAEAAYHQPAEHRAAAS